MLSSGRLLPRLPRVVAGAPPTFRPGMLPRPPNAVVADVGGDCWALPGKAPRLGDFWSGGVGPSGSDERWRLSCINYVSVTFLVQGKRICTYADTINTLGQFVSLLGTIAGLDVLIVNILHLAQDLRLVIVILLAVLVHSTQTAIALTARLPPLD